MKEELRNYEIMPKMVKCGEPSTIAIRPLGSHAAFDGDAGYMVCFMAAEESMEPKKDREYPHLVVRPENHVLSFEHIFEGEQEHYLRVFKLPGTDRPIGTFRVYSLKEDLYLKRPYRGDFHVHTCRSDGREEPAVVAANYRKSGFDFLAITDHHRWAPSEEAIQAYRNVPVDLKLFHGEEIHAFDNHIHIVNFGGASSVNELFENNREKYYEEVQKIASRISVPEGVNAFEYASCVWVFEKIREFDGLGIFCHPFWISDVYHVQQKMVDWLFENLAFDAFELLGGHEVLSNNLQTAYYNEARSRGMRVPVVGSSDSHGSEDAMYFNWFSTIVFSEGLEVDSINEAVKGLYSVAVEQYPGEACRVYGPYRLVKYALFLLEEYFPLHGDLCREEGRLMKDWICGDAQAAALLEQIRGRTGRLLEKSFCRLAAMPASIHRE